MGIKVILMQVWYSNFSDCTIKILHGNYINGSNYNKKGFIFLVYKYICGTKMITGSLCLLTIIGTPKSVA